MNYRGIDKDNLDFLITKLQTLLDDQVIELGRECNPFIIKTERQLLRAARQIKNERAEYRLGLVEQIGSYADFESRLEELKHIMALRDRVYGNNTTPHTPGYEPVQYKHVNNPFAWVDYISQD
jgi:hypothetical protein